MLEGVGFAINDDFAFFADIDDAHFSPIKEVLGPKLGSHAQNHFLRERDHPAGDNAVDIGIDELDFVFAKRLLDQVFLPKSFGVVMGVVFLR